MEPGLSGKRKEPENNKEETMPTYYFKDGYRYVKDYKQIIKFYTKRRWIGCNILDVLTKEFKLFPSDYYVRIKIR